MVHAQMFGQFAIKNEKGTITEEAMRSDQLVKLLSYILLHRDRVLGIQELSDILWQEEETNNPAGALKNLIYRLRNVLKPLGLDKALKSQRGFYYWSKEEPVIVDCEVFEKHSQKLKEAQLSQDEQRDALEDMLMLYQGEFLPKLSVEHWILPISTYYHSIYLNAVKDLSAIYEKERNFEDMELICNQALGVDSLDEELNCYLIKSLMGQNKHNVALRQYQYSVKALRESLGVRNLEKMQEVYNELMSSKNKEVADLQNICVDITEEKQEGTFVCEYPVFREIYRLEARRVGRMGIAEYVLLFTLAYPGTKQIPDHMKPLYMRRAVDALEKILNSSLRVGDVVARYSDTQFVVLLPACTYEAATKVIKRIVTKFEMGFKEYVQIRYDLEEISQNSSLFA